MVFGSSESEQIWHEYKRQQMNALYIIHKYLEIKGGKKPNRPLTFIFGAKAAPAYIIAQDIIHLILVLQDIVNHDWFLILIHIGEIV